MFCTHCARFNPPGTARCGGCGARLEWSGQPTGQHRRSGSRSALLLLPLLLAFSVFALVGWRTLEERQAQSAAYDRALAALEAGNLPVAIDQFGEAGGFRDAQEQRVTTQQLLAPYQAAYLDAQAALAEGENQRAAELLRMVTSAMPNNADAAALLATAEDRFRSDLEREFTVATTNHDWLEAERAVLTLAALNETPPDIAVLTELRLAHAPVLFTRDGSLFQIGPDQGDERLIFDQMNASEPLWSPDRSRIAFFSALPNANRFAALFIIDADGGNLTLVDDGAIRSLPAWSPDGSQLAYVGTAQNEQVIGASVLRLFDVKAGQDRAVPRPDGLIAMVSPSWSSDGRRMAAIGIGRGGDNLVLMVDSSTLKTQTLLDETPANARAVAWSATSDTLLLWTTTGDSDWYALRGSVIYLVSLEDRSLVPVTSETQAPSRPVWAPDGVSFAYLERGATLHVRVRTGIGERVLELPQKGGGKISWSPGGEGISVSPLDPMGPSMIVPVASRLGPVELLAPKLENGWPPAGFQWGPYTAPDPAAYDPFPATPTP